MRSDAIRSPAETAFTRADDPALLDALPLAGDIVTMAPDRIKEAIYAAFDIHALYRHDQHQVTIWSTITAAALETIAALTDDPRPDAPQTGTRDPSEKVATYPQRAAASLVASAAMSRVRR